ncbi:hypothetical protein [Streptomyces hirsutus]
MSRRCRRTRARTAPPSSAGFDLPAQFLPGLDEFRTVTAAYRLRGDGDAAGPVDTEEPGASRLVGDEVPRTGHVRTLTIPARPLQYLHQGSNPDPDGDHNSLPWRLGLLTQSNSTC